MINVIADWWSYPVILVGILAGGAKLLGALTQLREAQLRIEGLERGLREGGHVVVLPGPEEIGNRGKWTWLRVAGVLVIAFIVGLAVLVVVPQFSARASKEEALASNLATMRQAIEMYKSQHPDQDPDERFIELLIAAGVTSAEPDSRHGPYLVHGSTEDHVDERAAVQIMSPLPEAGGWAYGPYTEAVLTGTPAKDSSGIDYLDLDQ